MKFSQHLNFANLECPYFATLCCANPKTVNTRIISGMLLCCEEKANQMQDEKTASCSGN